jgi:hypothetical protein
MRSKSNGYSSFVGACFFSVLMFLYLYNVSFLSVELITTTRIALFIFLILLFRSAANINKLIYYFKKNLFFTFLFLPFLFWVAVQYVFGGADSTQLSRSVYFFLYVLIFSHVVAVVIGTKSTFLYAVFYAGVFQAVLVIISFMFPEYKEWLVTIVRETGNVALMSNIRSPGFSNGASSALSLVISLSVFSGMLIFKDMQSVVMKLCVLMLVVLIVVSTIFVGRLGLIMSLYFISSILIIALTKSFKNLFVLCVGIGVVFVLGPVVYDYFSQNSVFEGRLLSWAFSFLSGDDATAFNLSKMNIPEFSINNIFFGNGDVTLPSGLNASGSDIGYIQTYYAVGLIMAMYFYILLFIYLFSRLACIRNKLIGVILIAPIFLLEIKEPFIFKYMYPFFALTYLLLSNDKVTRFNKKFGKRLRHA